MLLLVLFNFLLIFPDLVGNEESIACSLLFLMIYIVICIIPKNHAILKQRTVPLCLFNGRDKRILDFKC